MMIDHGDATADAAFASKLVSSSIPALISVSLIFPFLPLSFPRLKQRPSLSRESHHGFPNLILSYLPNRFFASD